MSIRLPVRRIATMLVLVGLGAVVGGCYYVVPAYPPPGVQVPPGSVYVPGRWVWSGYAWVWQPGYWTAPAQPSATPAGAAAAPAVDPGRPQALDELNWILPRNIYARPGVLLAGG